MRSWTGEEIELADTVVNEAYIDKRLLSLRASRMRISNYDVLSKSHNVPFHTAYKFLTIEP